MRSALLLVALGLSAFLHIVTAGDLDSAQRELNQKRADHPSLKVAIRQPGIDYGTTVGLKTLKQHVEQIVVPDVSKEINIPVIGTIKVEVTALKCVDFLEPRSLTEIEIDDDSFHAKAQEVSATFEFHWHWKTESLPISGSGEGTAQFLNGDVDMKFQVQDEGKIMILVEDASAEFDDINISISKSAMSFLYNTILQLFHQKLVHEITDLINMSIKHDVPKALNSYLSDLPSAINISGLPMDAAFRYALYTHGFILVSAFPTIGRRSDSPASEQPTFVRPAQIRLLGSQLMSASQQLRTVSDDKTLFNSAAESDRETRARQLLAGGFNITGPHGGTSKEEQLKLTAHTLLQALLGRGVDGFPAVGSQNTPHDSMQQSAALQASDVMQESCPASSSPLNITDDSVLADTHMATAYVNDALPQCLLWGLNRKGLLQYCVRDGDVPGVRLITEVFQMLIPGIYQSYPHRRLAMTINATAEPSVEFVHGKGLHFAAEYETRVWVLPEDPPNQEDIRPKLAATDQAVQEHGSCADEGAIQVAVLETKASGVANVQYESTLVSDLDIKYTVKESPFQIHPVAWERTIKYVLEQVQDELGIHALWQIFVQKDVASRVHVQHAAGTYWDGWYKLSVDFEVDT